MSHETEAEVDAWVATLVADPTRAAMSAVERVVIDYALTLNREPWAISAADIDRLRAAGLDDGGIHDVCSIVAYFAFVNRIADGLGVELEADKRDA
jgi:uncharacterized peroxidase-related enzyme